MGLLRRLLISFLVVSLSIATAQASLISKQQPLPNFHHVNVSGDMRVNLIASTQYSDLRLIGTPNAIARVDTKVVNGTLYIRMQRPHRQQKPGQVTAIIRGRYIDNIAYNGSKNFRAIGINSPGMELTLNTPGKVNLSGKMGIDHLNLHGSGVINITGLKSHDLTVNSTGSDVVNIMGEANLQHLKFSGSGWMSMYWINSPRLKIEGSGKGYVQLAGRVGTLTVDLCQKAYLNAHYLRTKKVFIKTNDYARADLQTTDVQNALAKGNSNIYYFKTPDFNADYMAHYGTVMSIADMG